MARSTEHPAESAPCSPEPADRRGPGAAVGARSRAWRPELLAAACFVGLAALFFGRALFGGAVLLPIDALFLYAPWRQYAAQFGVAIPNNHLIADTILQNYSWKALAAQAYASGQLPLWNPYILAGQPFLAAGQNASLYPPGVLYYLLPDGQAYGWFAAAHLALGGLLTYWFVRVLGGSRFGALVGGVTFAFCGYLVVGILWPMVVSTAVWLPGLLAVVEQVVRAPRVGEWESGRVGAGGRANRVPILLLGAGLVTMQFLAGHLEMSLYLLATAGLYTALRLGGQIILPLRPARQSLSAVAGTAPTLPLSHSPTLLVGKGLVLLLMVALGSLGAGLQLMPFAEAIATNVRGGQVTYGDVRGYALPRQQLAAFVVPDFFGNPSHHAVPDLWSGGSRPVDRPLSEAADERWGTEWGPKNYVEGTAYLGLLPLLLAFVALLRRRDGPTWTLAIIAAICLLLAFGTPLYALLFFGVPGVNQLHTPFRWVYPYSLCLAALAGLGASMLGGPARRRDGVAEPVTPSAPGVPSPRATGSPTVILSDAKNPGCHLLRFFASLRMTGKGLHKTGGIAPVLLGLAAAALGTLGTFALLLAYLLRDSLLLIAERALRRSAALRETFPDAQALYSYQWANLLGPALLLLASGLVLLALARRAPAARPLALALLVGDLFTFGIGFNTAADPAPLRFVPPEIQALRADAGPEPFRIATLGPDDTLPANTGMLFGLHDLRGYDTIILRDYVDYLELIEPQSGLLYSKVHKLFNPRSLDSPLLDLLNVRYVLTSLSLTNPGWQLVHDGPVRVYRNARALPRAFIVPDAVAATDPAEARRLLARPDFDPRRQVVLEAVAPSTPPLPSSPSPLGTFLPPRATVASYDLNGVVVDVLAPRPGYLVLGDVYFPGWTVRVDGQERALLRANRAFRAVELPSGQHRVTFEYKPLSFRLGGLLSLLALGLAGLALGAWGYVRLGIAERAGGPVGRVVKNSVFPLVTGLLNKALDFGFALVYLRLLGPQGTGAYTFAVVVVGYFDVLVNFGLSTLLTREVARDPAQADRYFANTLATRLGLASLALLGALALAGPLAPLFQIGPEVGLAIVLLTLGMLPGALASTASAMFMARERMEVPAAVTVLTTLTRIGLGTAVLLAGWGIVGLALVSLALNLLNAAVLGGLLLALLGRPRLLVEPRFGAGLLVIAWPLMLNNFLNSLFFRIDAVLLKPLAGELALGYYSTAYRFIDGLQIIPSTFVLALFPVLARQAGTSRDELVRAFSLGLKVLLVLSLPISVGTTLLAEPIIHLFAGPAYLPDAALALAVLIWYLPFSFVNGLTQYVLIALNRQRWITVAFFVTAIVNLSLNLLLIPRYGYLAAAAVTVVSEWVLIVPFWYAVRKDLPPIPLLGLAGRPALAALVMGAAVYWLRDLNPWLAMPLGAWIYAAALLALGAVSRDELRALRRR